MFCTSIYVIEGKLYINHPENMNHVREDNKYLVSVINYSGEIYKWRGHSFNDGLNQTDLGKRAHVLKHLHGRNILGPFEIFS